MATLRTQNGPESTDYPPNIGPFTGIPAGAVPDHTDIVLSNTFIVLFLSVGIYFHYRTFDAYRRRFIWSLVCFGLCMSRVVVLALCVVAVKVSQLVVYFFLLLDFAVTLFLLRLIEANERWSDPSGSGSDDSWCRPTGESKRR